MNHRNRREWLKATGTALGLASASAAVTAAIPPPEPHPIDKLYDALAETWGPAAGSWEAYEHSGVFQDKERNEEREAAYEAAYGRYRDAERERASAWGELSRAILAASGCPEPTDRELKCWGRAFCVVRTPKRAYAIVPSSDSNEEDLLGLAEIVAIDL